MADNSITTTAAKCDNCGLIRELGKPIPVVAEDGTVAEIAICDSEDCQTNCIPVQPAGFFTLQSGRQRVRWAIGTCDECGEQFDTTTMLQGKTEDGYTDWLCPYCYARQHHDDATTHLLLNILKSKENKPMKQVTITREDGTPEQVLMRRSVAEELTDSLSHEFVLWSDAGISIDSLVPQFKGDTTLDQIHLDLAGVRKLRDFLNSARVAALLNS